MNALVQTIRQIINIVFGSYVSLGQPFGKGAFAVFIPCDAVKIGHDLSQDYVDAATQLYLAKMAETFGGVTLIPSFGGWLNHEGTLITENVQIAISFAKNPTLEQVSAVATLARRIRYEFHQDCVTAVAYGEAFLVE